MGVIDALLGIRWPMCRQEAASVSANLIGMMREWERCTEPEPQTSCQESCSVIQTGYYLRHQSISLPVGQQEV